jgi:hypothetical protein
MALVSPNGAMLIQALVIFGVLGYIVYRLVKMNRK